MIGQFKNGQFKRFDSGRCNSTNIEVDKELSLESENPVMNKVVTEKINELVLRLNTLIDSDDVTLDQLSEIVTYIKSNKTLIENVTTNKVNVTDIIDNLTTNVGDKVLSAKQGFVLKGLIDTLSDEVDGAGKLNPAILINEGDDLNNYLEIGTYKSPSSTISETLLNTPYSAGGFRLVVTQPTSITSVYRRQLLESSAKIGRTFVRVYSPTEGWGEWAEFYTTLNRPTANDVGALPLTGGVSMTGSFVQKDLTLTDGITDRKIMEIFTDGSGKNYGHEVVISGAGNMFIGGGESPVNLRNTLQTTVAESGTLATNENYSQGSENCYLTSDGGVYISTACNSIASRKTISITNGAISAHGYKINNVAGTLVSISSTAPANTSMLWAY